MQLLERSHPMLECPVPKTDAANISESTLIQIRNIVSRKKLEVLAATQVGVKERLLVGYLDGTIQTMVNPRIVNYDDEDYLYMKIPTLHTTVDFTCKYWNNITLEWEWCGASNYTEKREMYGIQAALYQHALSFLNGDPPWRYKKQVDW